MFYNEVHFETRRLRMKTVLMIEMVSCANLEQRSRLSQTRTIKRMKTKEEEQMAMEHCRFDSKANYCTKSCRNTRCSLGCSRSIWPVFACSFLFRMFSNHSSELHSSDWSSFLIESELSIARLISSSPFEHVWTLLLAFCELLRLVWMKAKSDWTD